MQGLRLQAVGQPAAATSEVATYQGPKRPHKHKDPTNHGFWNPRLSWAECRILVFMWSLGPL